ncbi:MAG: tryptophan synthase subunit alpha [Nitrospirae bacterium]|nr:tryptophan synthase subunit alpha [Nitrospirota bacterium]
MSKIKKIFDKLKSEDKKAFIPYIMAGDPSLEKTREHLLLLERCGADIIELGVPFSDPLADGPTIQRAAERALKAGIALKDVIQFVKGIRQNMRIPLVLMTYYNPVFKYGEGRFVKDAVDAGIDGVIIPDLPPDEGKALIGLSKKAGFETIFLVAPTSTEERIRIISKASSGFIYYVAITGITGSRLALDKTFEGHIGSVKQMSGKPVAVGFGVAAPDDARMMAGMADGVIVGSAIVKKLHENQTEAEEFIKKLREAI